MEQHFQLSPPHTQAKVLAQLLAQGVPPAEAQVRAVSISGSMVAVASALRLKDAQYEVGSVLSVRPIAC